MASRDTHINWIILIDYYLMKKRLPTDQNSWTSQEWKEFEKKKLIDKGRKFLMSSKIDTAINIVIDYIQTCVLDVLEQNDALYFNENDKLMCDRNNIIKIATDELSIDEKTYCNNYCTRHTSISKDDSRYNVYILELNIKNEILMEMKGYWYELLGIVKSHEYIIKKMNTYDKYIVRHNWNEPYVIIHDNDKKIVYIFTNEEHDCYLVMKYKNIKRILPGIDKTSLGNSVLIELENNNYVFIGLYIYEFCTPESEKNN